MLPPLCLQVYDQASERRGHVQADQKHAAAKLTQCFFSRTETGTTTWRQKCFGPNFKRTTEQTRS